MRAFLTAALFLTFLASLLSTACEFGGCGESDLESGTYEKTRGSVLTGHPHADVDASVAKLDLYDRTLEISYVLPDDTVVIETWEVGEPHWPE